MPSISKDIVAHINLHTYSSLGGLHDIGGETKFPKGVCLVSKQFKPGVEAVS